MIAAIRHDYQILHPSTIRHQHLIHHLLDRRLQGRATKIRAPRMRLLQHIAHEIIIIRQRTHDSGTARIDNQSHALVAKGIQRIAHRLLRHF